MTLSDLVAAIDSERQHGNLSSAKRVAQGRFDLVLPGLGRKDRQPALCDP
jgi:predicted DNA-binding ribbon-helix-helix protein